MEEPFLYSRFDARADFGAATDHDLQLSAMRNRLSQPLTVLLIVDVQNGLVGLMSAEIRDSVLPKIKTLLTKARASRIPVIFIQHDGAEGHPLETHTEGWKICPSLQPADGECVVRKRESDSFFGTTLQQELEKRGIAHLIVAGAMTEYCVDTTCRRAVSLGYDVTLASDAHLTRDNGVLMARNIIAHHNFVLDDLGAGDHVIKVRPTDEIVF
jgi:nicotinamidase-related amidase